MVGAVVLAGLSMLLGGCNQAAAPTVLPAAVEQQPTATELLPATATLAPTATVTFEPTATATTEPTATATQPPTATPVPPLAVLENGFSAWCLPETYAGVKPSSHEGPADANRLTVDGEQMQLRIPAVFCAMVYQFNQPVPEGAVLTLFDGGSPFLRLPLQTVAGQPDLAWAPVQHAYVVNPPLWQVTYQLALNAPDGSELWSGAVNFARPQPDGCPFGGLPDPVTMWCTVSDPWEIEPWPDVTYPYDRTKLPTPED